CPTTRRGHSQFYRQLQQSQIIRGTPSIPHAFHPYRTGHYRNDLRAVSHYLWDRGVTVGRIGGTQRSGGCPAPVTLKPLILLLFASLSVLHSAYARCTGHGSALATVQNLGNACQLFSSDYGVFPPVETWWEEITAAPTAVINTRGKAYAQGDERN